MSNIFPYANIISGIMILIVGFCFHWVGQLISVLNWDLATRIGLQEKDLLPEYKAYEHAIAVADVLIAWIYGVTAVGLFLNTHWGYRLAWVPGTVLIYHTISAWVWEGNRRKAGHGLMSDALRIGWCSANLITGVFSILVAWAGRIGNPVLAG